MRSLDLVSEWARTTWAAVRGTCGTAGGARRFTLRAGDVWRSRDRRLAVLHVETGRVWLTTEGTARDVLLGPGDRLLVVGGGLIVAQSVTAAPAVLSSE